MYNNISTPPNNTEGLAKAGSSSFRRSKIKNIDEIKEALTIQKALQALGVKIGDNDKKVCCPLHSEKTPSFSIYSNNQLWSCFGECSTGGDVIRLIELMNNNISYIEAVQRAGEIVGIEPEYSNLTDEEIEAMKINSLKYNFFKELAYFFNMALYSHPEAKKSREYLVRRSVDETYISKFSIGYAPFEYGPHLEGLMKMYDIDTNTLVEWGILGIAEDDSIYCRLKDAVVFPIIENEKVVGFTGRKLWDKADKKYIKAGEVLGLWNSDCIKEGEEVVIFEGVFDAITGMMAGVENASALLGVNVMGDKEAEIAKRTSKIYLYLDEDDAGEKASYTIAKRLGHKAYIVEGSKVGNEKDLNGLFVKMWVQEKEDIDITEYEEKYNELLADIKAVLDKKIKGAKNLIQLEIEKWIEMEDETERLDKLQGLIRLAYEQ